jgi:hypothetical protein
MLPKGEKDFSFIVRRGYPVRHKSTYIMVIVFLLIVAGGYIIFHSSSIYLGPALVLNEPRDGAAIRGENVKIQGKIEPKTRLTINGYETLSGDDGIFNLELPFQKGFHTLEVKTKNRIGKEARVVRHIVVE